MRSNSFLVGVAWPASCEAFAFSAFALAPGAAAERRPEGRPEILLCTRGEVRVVAGDRPVLVLAPGDSAFVDPSTPHYRLSADAGEAEVYRVRGSS